MEQVPNIISTKDFAYISDMFEWNFNASKQLSCFAQQVKTEEFKQLLSDLASMHSQHCHFLLNLLQGGYPDEQ